MRYSGGMTTPVAPAGCLLVLTVNRLVCPEPEQIARETVADEEDQAGRAVQSWCVRYNHDRPTQ